MFSEAISSISCRWRPSSSEIAFPISGSASASIDVKKPGETLDVVESVGDVLGWANDMGGSSRSAAVKAARLR
jgi:hypothetical protein